MKGVNNLIPPKEFMFIFAAMPALTGFFFSIFDVYVLVVAAFLFLSGRLKVSFQSLAYLLIIYIFTTATCLFSKQSFVLLDTLQWALFVLVLLSCWWLLASDFFDVRKAMYYWMLGIIPNFIVAALQNIYPHVEVFNIAMYKSSPLPGYDFIRSTGLLYNPNTLAAFSVMAFWLSLIWGRKIVTVLCVLTAVLTFSKTVLLMPLLYLLKFILRKNDIRKALYLVFGMSVSLAFLYFALDFLSYRMANANSLDSRVYILEVVAEKVTFLSQVLFGLGLGADVEESIGRIHNKFLSIFFQFGFFGSVIHLGLMAYVFRCIMLFHASRLERFYLLVFLLIFCSMGMVSTWTYFSFEYLVILFCLKASKATRPLFEKI